MAAPDDIAKSFPQPPPPSPARREAAIEAALRRFDGTEDQPAASAAGRGRPSWWSRLNRQQAGALITAALVALVGAPVAWISFNQWSDTGKPVRPAESYVETAPVRGEAEFEASSNLTAEAPPKVVVPGKEAASATLAQPPAAEVQRRASPPAVAVQQELAHADTAAPSPPVPSEKVAAEPPRSEAAPSGFAAKPMARMPAPQREAMADELAGNEEIIVTGAQRAKRRIPRRGDWNACTVSDPDESLRGCQHLVNPALKGPAGRAAAHVADGLTRAWQGNLAGAIAAFDQAIAASPGYAFAWLNRGLVHERMGDSDRALSDLNQAVRYAPGTARGYYHRSLLLRQKGETKRARFDEERAIDLDPRYADVVQ